MIDMKNKAFAAISTLAILAMLGGCSTNARLTNEFLADLEVLKSVCEKYSAGDYVYRRVDEVQGVFKASVVNPYPDWGSQYGMKAPWVSYAIRNNLFVDVGDTKGGSYWYVEAPPKYGDERIGIFRRNYCDFQMMVKY